MHTGKFTFNGASVTVQKPTVSTRVRLWQLRQSLTEHGTGDVSQDVADTLCYYLANTIEVDGSLGFPVPLTAPTHDQLLLFLNGFSKADEQLVMLWDKALYNLKYATNDPDLLPPQEVGEKKEEMSKSDSKD